MVQLCEQTLFAAEKNFTSSGTRDLFEEKNCSVTECLSFPRLWRWHLISKSYFYMGKLEMALDLLEKLEKLGSAIDKYLICLSDADSCFFISVELPCWIS